jgi:hypothetical protein
VALPESRIAGAAHHEYWSRSLIGRTRDPRGNNWGELLRWTDDDSRLHTHLVPDADLHREMSALIARLADITSTSPNGVHDFNHSIDLHFHSCE